MDWITLAQALPLGGKDKVEHDCGPGRPLVIWHRDDGWSAYCHRCHDKLFKPKPLPTLQERLDAKQREAAAVAAVERDTRPPQPAVFDVQEWPSEARLWLYKAGLTVAEIQALGCYYHPPTKRVVLPVVERGAVTFWQARCIFGNGPKYLSMPGGRERCLPLYGEGHAVTLTEDILSAYKISTAGHRALSLMGTSLLPVAFDWIIKHKPVVNIWLDPDGAGQRAASQIRDQLALVGISSRRIMSPRDPKLHSKPGIRDLLTHDPKAQERHA